MVDVGVGVVGAPVVVGAKEKSWGSSALALAMSSGIPVDLTTYFPPISSDPFLISAFFLSFCLLPSFFQRNDKPQITYQDTQNPVIMAQNTNGNGVNGVQSLPPEAIAFATRMYDAARAGQMDIFQQALPAGLPANMTNEKGDSLVGSKAL